MLAKGIHTIKEINPDFFYVLLNVDMFTEWLQKNKSVDGYVSLNLCRNGSEFFYAKKTEFKKN